MWPAVLAIWTRVLVGSVVRVVSRAYRSCRIATSSPGFLQRIDRQHAPVEVALVFVGLVIYGKVQIVRSSAGFLPTRWPSLGLPMVPASRRAGFALPGLWCAAGGHGMEALH